MSLIIGISGKIGSGKDTFAKKLQETTNNKFELKSFARKLKLMGAWLTGTEEHLWFSQEGKNINLPEWGMTIGEYQQKLGTEAIRKGLHTETWVLSLMADLTPNSNWIITDVRFPNEADAIKNRGGLVVRINGDPNGTRAASKRDLTHASETSLDNYKDFDYVFTNLPPIENLDLHVTEFLAMIRNN
jgi:hypothetical protein